VEVDEDEDPLGAFLHQGAPRRAVRRQAAAPAEPSPFEKDFREYVAFIRQLGEEALLEIDPLDFWAQHGSRFPIIARIAAVILAVPATSADVERLFSITGRILSKYRANLSAVRVDMMTCLHGWLKDDYEATYGKNDKRAAKRVKVDQQFATLSARLEIIPAPENPDEANGEDDGGSDDEVEPGEEEEVEEGNNE